jgi:GNAT superfamily N-acetyltransferase
LIKNIKIVELDESYAEIATNIAYETYMLEKEVTTELPEFNRGYYHLKLKELFINGIGRIAIVDDKVVGYLAFGSIFYTGNKDEKGATSPSYGYGVLGKNRGKVISRLFQETASELCEKHASSLRVSVYSNDYDVLNTFTMSSFAMNLTELIRDTDNEIEVDKLFDYSFRELTKTELLTHRVEVMALYRYLINHLRASPVFYHCRYFLPLEDRFEDFMSDEMRFFSVFHNDKLVGMIDSEAVNLNQFNGDIHPIGLGDISINPSYHGMGIAKALLSFTNSKLKDDGYDRILVTHGTINPAARGFWGKYFKNYTYTMTRKIDKDMLGIIPLI